jgi:hypothetical protein
MLWKGIAHLDGMPIEVHDLHGVPIWPMVCPHLSNSKAEHCQNDRKTLRSTAMDLVLYMRMDESAKKLNKMNLL